MLFGQKVVDKKFFNIEFGESLISIERVTKVVSRGRIFSFSVLVVIGNKNGCFGIGIGKALEITSARIKAINNAKKNLYQTVLTKDKTITHVVTAKYGATKVIIRPARVGRGVIAGGAMRTILESLGVKDVVAKCIGSSNRVNLSYATVEALLKVKSHKYYSILKSFNKKLDFNKTSLKGETPSCDMDTVINNDDVYDDSDVSLSDVDDGLEKDSLRGVDKSRNSISDHNVGVVNCNLNNNSGSNDLDSDEVKQKGKVFVSDN